MPFYHAARLVAIPSVEPEQGGDISCLGRQQAAGWKGTSFLLRGRGHELAPYSFLQGQHCIFIFLPVKDERSEA